MGQRIPMPIPFGWYCIGYVDELAVGEVRNVHYFDRDMVLFRTEGGSVGLSDPFCPHLGAHLGHGGEVVGESIRCPFHHWSYNTEGFVTDVPYAKQIPPKAQGKACLKTYPVVEKNQIIWAWYHPQDVEPSYEVKDIPETADADWTELERFYWEFDSAPQEIAENGVDAAHFKYIHCADEVPEGETSYQGVERSSKVFNVRDWEGADGQAIEIKTTTHITQYGAGQKWVRNIGIIDAILMVLVTPITEEKVEFRFAFTFRRYDKDSMEYGVTRQYLEANTTNTGVVADIPVWHNKIHLREPLLCDGDGPIMQFRKYFSQFYVEGPYGDGEHGGEGDGDKLSLVG